MSLDHSCESAMSSELAPFPRRRRGTSAYSESLVGSYMASRYPTRFNSVSVSGVGTGVSSSKESHARSRTIESAESAEILSASVLLQLPEGTSWWAGVIIMTNCTIGMGLLNFPRAVYNAGGLLNAMVVQCAILGLIVMSLYMVGRCIHYYGNVSYQDMVISHLGLGAGAVSRLLILLNNLGACIMSLVVLGDQFELLMYMIFDRGFCSNWYMRRSFFVPVATACVILPFCLLKRFDFFKYTSFIGVLSAVYIAFGVGLGRAITGVDGWKPNVRFSSPVSSKIVSLVPVICFAYECHIELPPMYACLKRQDMPYVMRLIVGYVVTSFVVYSVGGVGGYIALGDNVAGDFLLGFPRHDLLVTVAMGLISLKALTTFPVIFFCVRSVVDDVWRQRIVPPSFFAEETPRRYAQTLTIVGVTCLVAVLLPSISVVIGLVGGVSACFVFVYPGLCYMQMHLKSNGGMFGVACGVFFAAFGVFLLASTTVSAAFEFSAGESTEPVLCR